MIDKLLKEARALREITVGPVNPALEPSSMWIDRPHKPTDLILSADSDEQAIERMTGLDYFTFPVLTTDPAFKTSLDNFVAFLAKNGTPIKLGLSCVQESNFAASSIVGQYDGQRVSIPFLWHLSIASRFLRYVPDGGRVLELGGGYGGVARIVKHLRPDVRYVMVDMRDSLLCAYVYLRKNLPEARVEWAHVPGEAHDLVKQESEIVLVPTQSIGGLKGFRINTVLNTQSLSEMREETQEWYVDWIQHELNAERFYSVNRYELDPAGTSPDVGKLRLAFNSYWIERFRDLGTLGGCYALPLPKMLEILFERTDE